jgi:four helix bundle protein
MTIDQKTLLNWLMTKSKQLEERAAVLGETVIESCLNLITNAVVEPLVRQLVRAATSIGANYCEADEAESKKDFRHKIALCRKESRETKFWLRMIAKACASHRIQARVLWREVNELHLIFCAIIRTTDKNLRIEQQTRRTSSAP